MTGSDLHRAFLRPSLNGWPKAYENNIVTIILASAGSETIPLDHLERAEQITFSRFVHTERSGMMKAEQAAEVAVADIQTRMDADLGELVIQYHEELGVVFGVDETAVLLDAIGFTLMMAIWKIVTAATPDNNRENREHVFADLIEATSEACIELFSHSAERSYVRH